MFDSIFVSSDSITISGVYNLNIIRSLSIVFSVVEKVALKTINIDTLEFSLTYKYNSILKIFFTTNILPKFIYSIAISKKEIVFETEQSDALKCYIYNMCHNMLHDTKSGFISMSQTLETELNLEFLHPVVIVKNNDDNIVIPIYLYKYNRNYNIRIIKNMINTNFSEVPSLTKIISIFNDLLVYDKSSFSIQYENKKFISNEIKLKPKIKKIILTPTRVDIVRSIF